MIETATAINTFGPSSKVGFVSPSDQLITLTYGQLQNLVRKAIERAIQPLQDRIEALNATVANQGEEIASLRSTVTSLENLQEQDTSRICMDIAYDRRRLTALEHPAKKPGKTELSRAEKIEKYLASRPDHKATFETLKGHLGIDNDLLGIAIKSLLPSGKYAIIKTPGDKRKRTLVMLPR